MSSCDALKKVPREKKEDSELGEIQSQKKYNPKTGKWETVTEVSAPIDTVVWNGPDRDDPPPIVSENTGVDTNTDNGEVPDSEKLERYKVAVLLPFMNNRNTGSMIDDKSLLAINFYGGMKMAFDELSAKNVKLDVTVLDTEGSEETTRQLLQRDEVKNADVLIGPLRKDNLKLAAAFAKGNRKPLVSPLSPSSTVTEDNPYYIQFAPTLVSHCKAITRHVRERYDTDQVVLVTRNKKAETRRMKYFHDANAEIEGGISVEKFKEFVISDASADLNEVDIQPYFVKGKTTVFVVPSWSNETFVYSLLRKIRTAKGRNNVVVYGMPQWMKYQRISFDYYEALNVHVSSSVALDPEAEDIETFNRNFYYKFGAPPTEDAFIGYDITSYVGKLLEKYGNQFQNMIDRESGDYMHTRFEFQPTPGSAINIENIKEIGHYENMHVNILQFKDYYFQEAN